MTVVGALQGRMSRIAAELKRVGMQWHAFRRRGKAAPFASVAVETSSHCHRRCSYCPVSVAPKPKRLMEMALFERIVGDLAGLRYDGRFAYHFYNEPLLNRDLEAYVRVAAEALPQAHHVVYTCGDHLTEVRAASLMAAGLDAFVVSDHGGRTLTPAVDAARRGLGGRRGPIRYRRVMPERALFNRGGLVAVANPRRPGRCAYPAYELIVGIDGDVLLCCNDYFGENAFGNVRNASLLEIWHGARFARVREGLLAGRAELSICQACTERSAP